MTNDHKWNQASHSRGLDARQVFQR